MGGELSLFRLFWAFLTLSASNSGTALPASVTPAGFGRLLYDSKHVHGLRTEPQVAAGGKQNFWPRGASLVYDREARMLTIP